jgi:hypothetical protein
MVEAEGLKNMGQGHIHCHHLYTKFHACPPVSSKVLGDFLAPTTKV